MRIFERLRARQEPPPIQLDDGAKDGAKEAPEAAVPAVLDPQPEDVCCGHCGGKQDAAVSH